MKNKTPDEYRLELSKKRPTVIAVEDYVNAKTKILHKCLLHNIEWYSLPSNVIAGKGCEKCKTEKLKYANLHTNEWYLNQLKELNLNIEPLEKYSGSSNKIRHRCLTHDVIWDAYPNNILRGEGCKLCGKDKVYEKLAKQNDEYIEELSIKNATIEPIERYVNSDTKILHKCLIHNVEFMIKPSNALKGHGCEKCRKERVGKSNAIKNTDYVKMVATTNVNVKVVGEYKNKSTMIKHYCNKHMIYFDSIPSSILSGGGCPKCKSEKISKKNSLSNDEYLELVSLKNQNVIPLDSYTNMKTKMKHKCLIHDFVWYTTPDVILQGCGCPKCKSDKISDSVRLTNEEYQNKLRSVNRDIINIEEYDGTYNPIMHKCLIHNFEWKNRPVNILNGTKCPLCNESNGEFQVRHWLEDHDITFKREFIFNDCKDKKPLPFDFYLPEYNSCIEFQGKQHYEEVEFFGGADNLIYVQNHDSIKKIYCEENGIRLLCIPYYSDVNDLLHNFLYN